MAFNYQALRTMGHTRGAEPGECLAAMQAIRDGDTESWYAAWFRMGKCCEEWAERSTDARSCGHAYLRASNYYRCSEFFLNPGDERKIPAYNISAGMFQRGLIALGIRHEIWDVPYEDATMRAYFFPGDSGKPLIMVCGGYDSTNEESFFWIGSAAIERRYPCIMFEGPGQSNMIRKYGIIFTPAWEKPVRCIIDYAEGRKSELFMSRKILFGISLGGRLVPRAAALEKRIDALVIFGGAFYDVYQTALNQGPLIACYIHRMGMKRVFNIFAWLKSKKDIGLRWAINNGCWTMHVDNAYDLINQFHSYDLGDYAEAIACDVLILHGEGDHFYNEKAMLPFTDRMINARSIRHHTFRFREGSSAHCQAGALEQAAMVFFDWVKAIGEEKSDKTNMPAFNPSSEGRTQSA